MEKVTVEIDVDLKDLVPQFVENRKKDIASLKTLVQQKDLEAIALLTHKIKGAAAGYGFNELSEIAAQMETASKKQDNNSLADLMKKMETHFNNIEIRYVPM